LAARSTKLSAITSHPAAAIDTYLAEHNAHPKPFVWTKSAAAMLAKLERLPAPSECA